MAESPKNIQLIGEELAIVWPDGRESYIGLEFLRRLCPCAACGGEPDVMGNISRPKVEFTAQSFQMTGWVPIGGYAIQPRWADGHSTGIYSFAYLKKLAETNALPHDQKA